MTLSIRRLIEQVTTGQIRIPAFQRGFVWEMDRVAYFIDSLYKRYPFGSLLLWRTRNQLTHEKNLGPYRLPDRDPDFPIDYVLDGQQRITSIFGVFQTELHRIENPDWLDVYFDFDAEPNAQDSQFVAIPEADADPSRFFPMRTIFDPPAYRTASEGLSAERVKVIDELNSVFKELQVPAQYFETEDRTRVAIVFERVNRLGLELDTLQLLTAWTWSEDFDLQNRFGDLRETLADYGFSDVGDDTNLVLRCAAAVLNADPSAESLISLNGSAVRQQFERVENGIRGAVDFLRTQIGIESLSNLPYPALLVPLSVFFAEPTGKEVQYPADTYQRLLQWFWRSCFVGRYSGQTLRAARADIQEMHRLKNGETSSLGEIGANLRFLSYLFRQYQFRINSALTKTFILMLAQYQPRSFISGSLVDLRPVLQHYNRSEFHHIYPRKFLASVSGLPEYTINCLANFCFLNRAENNRIGGRAPSEYRQLMPDYVDEILESALCPPSVFGDNYEQFLRDRVRLLTMAADDLAENGRVTKVPRWSPPTDPPNDVELI
jgi:hypothetical protein